jgi:hypothetical protein
VIAGCVVVQRLELAARRAAITADEVAIVTLLTDLYDEIGTCRERSLDNPEGEACGEDRIED